MPSNFKSTSAAAALGTSLRRARLASGLSLLDLEGGTGVNHSQISRIERGQFKRPAINVQKLCVFLSVQLPTAARVSRQPTIESLQQRLAKSVAVAPHRARLLAAFFDALDPEQA